MKPLRVMHVIATGERRGAEMFASDLIRALDGSITQHVAVLRGAGVMSAGYSAPVTALRGPGEGVSLPGLRIDVRSVARLVSFARDWRPQIVHAHGGEPLKYAIAAARISGARLIYRRIGLVPERAALGLPRLAHTSLMRRADHIVAVADAVRRETIATFRIAPDRVSTIPRGVDPARIEPAGTAAATRRELAIDEDATVVLSLGALSAEKDPLEHLRTMAHVRRSIPDAIHMIAGDGPLRPAVEARITSERLDEVTRVLGNRADVAELLAATDVVLLASRSEGMPGCLIEAGIAGVPVAAYDVAGVPEVVLDGETGFTASAGDTELLAARVVKLLANAEVRQAMSAAARRRCLERFAIGVIGPRYLDLYQELAA